MPRDRSATKRAEKWSRPGRRTDRLPACAYGMRDTDMALHWIEVDGRKLAVAGEGNGPLIICSPGLGDTFDAFAPLAACLVARGYRVARVDLRGHGDSTARFNFYGDEATADDLLSALEKLGGGRLCSQAHQCRRPPL